MARHDITKNIIKHHGRYHLRKMLHGEHHLVDLHTMSLRTAKARARAEWRDILNREANGGIAKAKAYRSVPTLGEVSKVYLAATVGPKAVTRRHNLYCLRRLAVDVLGITHAAADKMRVNEVANVDLLAAWINQRKATPPKLSRHEAATRAPHELSKPGRLTPYDLNTVLITIEGAIKHARGVFSERSMHKDFGCLRNFNIPDLGGFMSLPLPEYEARIYRPPSPEEIGRVIEALPALEEKSPAVFVAILLGIGLGLRRGEIQHARWSMIEWVEGIPVLVIGATHDWAGTKGKHERRVEIAPSVYRKLIEHKGNETFIVPDARGDDASVRPADNRPRFQGRTKKRAALATGKTSPDSYRKSTSGTWGLACDCGRWLKSIGWVRRQKLHEMRKYFGAIVCTEAGIYAAKELLGHQDIKTTRDSYAGLVERVQFTGALDSALKLKAKGNGKTRKRRVG